MSLIQRWREWREARAEYRASIDEMKFHIERETEYNLGRGMSPREARRAALKAFGGVDRFAEQARDERTGSRVRDFAISYLDWKLGVRMLVKYPGLSIIGGLTLAAAIGLGTGWFQLTMLTIRPQLPFEDGERIVRVEYWDVEKSEAATGTAFDFEVWRDRLTTMERVGAYRPFERNLITADGTPLPVRGAEITPNAFPLTGVAPLMGRTLTDEDAVGGAPDAVVIGYGVWRDRFRGRSDIVGTEVQVGRSRATIVGVMPERFGFPRNEQLWLPLRMRSAAAPYADDEVAVFGKLRAGVTLEAVRAEAEAIGSSLAAERPATHTHLRARVHPFAAPSGSGARLEAVLINLFAWLLLGAAAVNVAALMFVRTAVRESEIVVRTALGASRLRIVAQLFTEALVLTGVAAAVGLVVAAMVMQYVFDLLADRLPFWFELQLEPISLLYAALLTVVGAALISLVPALRVTGSEVRAGLANAGTGGTSMRFGGVWSAVIVLQVAFSVLCLPFGLAAAFDATAKYRLRADFPANEFLTFRPAVADASEPGAAAATRADAQAELQAVVTELKRELLARPGIAAVTTTSALPGTYHPLRRVEVERPGEQPLVVSTNIDGDRVRVMRVGSDFLETMGMPLVTGRTFREADLTAPEGVAVINDALAGNIGGNPVGTRIRAAAQGDDEPGPWLEVVGVARSPALSHTGPGAEDFLFTPASIADAPFVMVRTGGDANASMPVLRAVALNVDPGLRINDLMTLDEAIRRYDLPTLQMTLVGIGVILLAIMLSAASLYALMSIAVTRRTREIGIRVAIGADTRAILSSLFSRAAAQIGGGIVVGNIFVVVLLSMSVDDLQARMIVPPMVVASVVMALVGFAACYVPGRRALRVQPTEALKEA